MTFPFVTTWNPFHSGISLDKQALRYAFPNHIYSGHKASTLLAIATANQVNEFQYWYDPRERF
ncbi:hypothetical protein M413DRAFT_447107 [Hebeloma cylindrosporum]|uniref:Uncharacterized protein n=1 Tax=Hebeloma cylindrosporum TaxID=76867 RepID=A0A0C2YF43_HEBCY|nr:hypothetical protein M413DRAFT_447107 [Hebeloma cylindrosporum h7]